MGNFEKAAEEYKKSSDLDPTFVFSHIQLAVANYKMKDVEGSMAAFEEMVLVFPESGEPYNY
jgi:import receptor subunit TOM70